ncbi:MAG TPA: tryptophan dimethylallyltransferase family protein [Polyangiaceae bacterium]|nr:tryptophan dimethylallyltransferase family protein [Polyangiaceae bacterium]
MQTMLDFGTRQLESLIDATGLSLDRAVARRTFEDLASSWRDRPVESVPRWSGLTDDCTPIEYSIVLGGRQPELRVSVEAQADPASPFTYWASGQRLCERLESSYGAELAVLRRIEDLFRPSDPAAYTAMYHGAVFRPSGKPLFKVYLSPPAQGAEYANQAVEKACERLGLLGSWRRIAATLRPRDSLIGLSVDVVPELGARLKLYVRHREPTLQDLERASSLADEYVPGDVTRFVAAMLGVSAEQLPSGVVLRRPPVSTYNLSAGQHGSEPHGSEQHGAVPRVTFHIPVFPFCVENDGMARDRIVKLLHDHRLSSDVYERCLGALANRDLYAEQGIHSYVSFQREDGHARITTYFCPRMYRHTYGPLALDPGFPWPSPVKAERPAKQMPAAPAEPKRERAPEDTAPADDSSAPAVVLNRAARVRAIRRDGNIVGYQVAAPRRNVGLIDTRVLADDSPLTWRALEQVLRPHHGAEVELNDEQLKQLLELGLLVRSQEHPARVTFDTGLLGVMHEPAVATGHAGKDPLPRRLAQTRFAFERSGFGVVRGLLPPELLSALQTYYRGMVREGYLPHGDPQSKRYYCHNEEVAVRLHQLLLPIAQQIVPEPIKPSYSYFACYTEGAELARHTDREQCEVTLSLAIDATPQNTQDSAWPLNIERADGSIEAVLLAPGDGAFLRGRVLPHFRAPLPAGRTSTSVFFHFVPAEFSGSLD